jgi:hypothetical protein
MFLHLLHKDNNLFIAEFDKYAERHYLKRFKKDYKGRQWEVTEDSIMQDLSRIKMSESDLQSTQQVDELWHKDDYWIFKYDFRVAQTKESTKTSGNRCIVFLDNKCNKISILIIYGKGDLPSNMGEQAYIEKTLENEFVNVMRLVK